MVSTVHMLVSSQEGERSMQDHLMKIPRWRRVRSTPVAPKAGRERWRFLVRRVVHIATLGVVLAMPHYGYAVVVSVNNGNALAAQYYTSQAYGEIKDSNGNNLTEGGRIANASVPVGADSQSGTLTASGATSVFNTFAALDGFARARASASLAVTNSGPSFGYTAVASQGSRTQGLFVSPQTPGRVVFNFNLSGSTSAPVDVNALGRLDFLARPFVGGSGSFFDVFNAGALHALGPNTYAFEYIGPTVEPLDILFYSAAAVIAEGVSTGASFNGSANFASTFELTSIDLFTDQGTQITDWSLLDLGTDQVVFNQNGRVSPAAPVPEPSSLMLMLLGMTGVVVARRKACAHRRDTAPGPRA